MAVTAVAPPVAASPATVAASAWKDGGLRFTGMAFLCLACGFLSPFQINLVGDLYGPELLLPLVALAARSSEASRRVTQDKVFRAMLLGGLVTLAGYVLSDLVQGSRPDQSLRGWGRVGLVIVDFVSLAVMLAQDRRNLWWFTLGAGLGGIAFLKFIEHAPLTLWKFGYAEPVLQVSAALSTFFPLRVSAVWILLLGMFSMVRDFRSFAAVCFLIGGYLWYRSRRPRQPLGAGATRKLILLGAVAGAMTLVALSMTGGEKTSRRAASDAGRIAAIEVGIEAVRRSPIIGHGSWVEDRELAMMYLKRQAELVGWRGDLPDVGNGNFSPHSQILHAWVEGGILGTALMMTLLWQLLRIGWWTLLQRQVDFLTPALLYILIATLWNLFMSPFSAPHRLGIATGAALLVLLHIERRRSLLAGTAAMPGEAAAAPATSQSTMPRQLVLSPRKLRLKRSTPRLPVRR